ncbi:protein POLLENLESS 3-LIKE 2 [Iris pallida]|uniref:Protein POLLENLESS 3-LIKE 2 n=1 Tax=Iris pallida TaxID=29817 RepID=A0AAX6HIU7_IRIPA|nr:protein POLLENLESS 3-LIKE 2 [Iris pallida]
MFPHQELWNPNAPPPAIRTSKSAPCSPVKMPIARSRSGSFHVAHKVPIGDTPYVKAKRVQLVDKDPERAIAMFWAAINAGDRVDSALKDMAIVMKQQNRAEEAVEAIKSLRHRCSDQAQESLDNILLDLYKRCGRLDDQIALLKHKLQLIQQGLAFNGKRTKTARSQGKKFQVSVEEEATRLLGNLGWALMQKEDYVEAEDAYRRALAIGPDDNNKMCNLGICLMKQGRLVEAKGTLKQVRPAAVDGLRGAAAGSSHLKAFERAQQMFLDLESKLLLCNAGQDRKSWLFDAAFLGSSSIWQPHPCTDHLVRRGDEEEEDQEEQFANENLQVDNNRGVERSGKPGILVSSLSSCNSLNIDAPPFYSARLAAAHPRFFHDPMAKLKRTRSGNVAEKLSVVPKEEVAAEGWPELPDNDEFTEAIVAAVLGPVLEEEISEALKDRRSAAPAAALGEGKRLRAFQDITLAINSPKSKISA